MEQNWFEMRKERRRRLDEDVWIPLEAAHQIQKTGTYGHAGYIAEYFQASTIAFPVDAREKVSQLGWVEIVLRNSNSGYFDGDKYIPSDIFRREEDGPAGLYLALTQHLNRQENRVWHLHQDFVTTLGLKREHDKWVRANEGYVEVARLKRHDDGEPYLLEVKASYLKDYLCARGMALYVSQYRERIEVVDDYSHVNWENNSVTEGEGINRWEGDVIEIHEGGTPYGSATAFFRIGRKDVDLEKDVPSIDVPGNDEVSVGEKTIYDSRRKLFRVMGSLWRCEWVEPAATSPIVRGDKVPPSAFFITDAEGKRESGETLIDAGIWLWFRPEVVNTILGYRGSFLEWGTRETGRVGCSPDDATDFGVNELGLVNVYAKDIGLLPEWQQKIWAGFNQGPEGGVSKELLVLQAEGSPVNTQAPENFLEKGLSLLNELSFKVFEVPILREHSEVPDLIKRSHRFRAINKEGLLALAKDLDRLTVERINKVVLRKFIAPATPKELGSIKILQHLLALGVDTATARKIVAPLVGINELRRADAHLPSERLDDSYELAHVDQKAPFITQGFQLMHACVETIYNICQLLDE